MLLKCFGKISTKTIIYSIVWFVESNVNFYVKEVLLTNKETANVLLRFTSPINTILTLVNTNVFNAADSKHLTINKSLSNRISTAEVVQWSESFDQLLSHKCKLLYIVTPSTNV